MPAGKLTPKQQRFVEEYLVDLNATRAYLRAGYQCSEEVARRNGARLLTNADIANAVGACRQKLAETTARTVADVMRDIGRVRDDAMKKVVDADTGDERMLSHKDALKALELEGKHLGAFEDRVTHSLGAIGPDWRALLRAPEQA
jgi:phage terminase small subunit